MAETRVIPTVTSALTSGVNVSIKTSYQEPDSLPDTIEARITSAVGIQDGTLFEQGELLIQMKNSPQNIDYMLDGDGNLILLISTGDENNYSIDSNGDLIYTEN
jgi:hypothetical protein